MNTTGAWTLLLELGSASTYTRQRDGTVQFLRRRSCRRSAFAELHHEFERWNAAAPIRIELQPSADGEVCMVTPRAPGHQFGTALGPRSAERSGGKLQLGEFLEAAAAVTQALADLHRAGLVHQNLKPSNIFVSSQGASLLDPSSEALLGEALHNLRSEYVRRRILPYLAPEQTGRMDRSVDSRADLYALGASFFEILAGVPPFDSTDPLEIIHSHLARRPPLLRQLRPELPEILVLLIHRLLEKDPERRYQTARGLLRDLEACLSEWDRHGEVNWFPLGRADLPQKLIFDGTLYGRDKERAEIEQALEDAVKNRTSLLLLSGPPGIGKSALARVITRSAYLRSCHVGVGKCDQLAAEQPYYVLRQALTEVVDQVLCQTEEVLGNWRTRFQETVGGLGGVILEFCPLLESIVGPQPIPPPLEPAEARARMLLALQRLVRVVATCGHSLVLFLDDLQWVERGTLDLLEHLLLTATSLPVLVIGSYRNTEVSALHPLSLTIRAIEAQGVPVRSCLLGPLSVSSVGELLSASFGRAPEEVWELAETVHEKTLGNPFFVRVFLQSLLARGFLSPDRGWTWNLPEIRARQATDNVVSLLCERMAQLPIETRRVLEYAALFGSSTALSDLMVTQSVDLSTLLRRLEPATSASLVRVREGRLTFVHDRVQEAALAMTNPDHLPARHLEIARMLGEVPDQAGLETRIFEYVSHLNAGRTVLSEAERLDLARMNLRAVMKAKRAAAFGTAYTLARAALECLTPNAWQTEYPLCFELHREHAELRFYHGDFAGAEALAHGLEGRAQNVLDQASARGLLVKMCIVQARFDEAIESAREALALIGMELPTEPARVEANFREQRARSETLLRGREPAELLDSPQMVDPVARLSLELLVRVNPAIFFRRPEMLGLNIVLMTNLSLEHGHTPVSAFAYAEFGFLCALQSEDYRRAYAFATLGLRLAEQSLDPVQICRVTHLAAWVSHYTQPLREADELFRRGFQAGCESGETEWAAYHAYSRATRILLLGLELEEARVEIERLREYVQRANSVAIVQLLDAVHGQIEFLTRCSDRDEHMRQVEARLRSWQISENPQALFIHFAYRSFSLALERRYDEALESAEQALSRQAHAPNHPFVELARFVRGLASVARLSPGAEVPEAAEEEVRRLAWLSEISPVNYSARRMILEAELGRVRGEGWNNGSRYELACRHARDAALVHEEGLSHQLAARFWLEHGQRDFYQVHARRAQACWIRWRASHLTSLIDEELPRSDRALDGVDARDGFDVRSLIKSSQAISGELDRSKLLSRVMHVILENAGAERGALICPGANGLELVVTANSDGTQDLAIRPLTKDCWVLIEAVRYAYRTRECVVLDDASQDARFSAEELAKTRQLRSVLCLPVGSVESLHGVLYLENALVTGAFTAKRLSIVEILASQASISLENAALFSRSQRAEQTLRASEEDLRITLDSIGDAVIATDARGHVARMNPVACQLTGYSLEEASDRPLRELLQTVNVRTRESTDDPVERVVRTGQKLERSEDTIVIGRNGVERRVSESGAPIRDARGEIVGVVLVFCDVTERHELEERFRQSQKMDALGRLAGGVAHDFNNMLAGILGSAELLAANLSSWHKPEIQWGVKTIIDSAMRAADLTKQLLAFSRKGKQVSTLVDLHEVIGHALALLERSIDRRIRIERVLCAETPFVIGDPALLQSALLNLGINARDAMPEGGRLRVASRCIHLEAADCEATNGYHLQPGDYVELEVTDSGCGMPPSVLKRIFEPFFTTKPLGKGTGLGLAAVHGTVVEHGGAIRVESCVGHGSRFWLWIPRERSFSVSVRTNTVPEVSCRPLCVLLVDDESVARISTIRLLESLGHRALVANDGREGVERFERDHGLIDLVLLDSIMPNLNGTEAFRQMRAIDPTVPVLLVSGFAQDAAVDELMAEGLDGFLMKPYTRASLVSTLSAAVERRRDASVHSELGKSTPATTTI